MPITRASNATTDSVVVEAAGVEVVVEASASRKKRRSKPIVVVEGQLSQEELRDAPHRVVKQWMNNQKMSRAQRDLVWGARRKLKNRVAAQKSKTRKDKWIHEAENRIKQYEQQYGTLARDENEHETEEDTSATDVTALELDVESPTTVNVNPCSDLTITGPMLMVHDTGPLHRAMEDLETRVGQATGTLIYYLTQVQDRLFEVESRIDGLNHVLACATDATMVLQERVSD